MLHQPGCQRGVEEADLQVSLDFARKRLTTDIFVAVVMIFCTYLIVTSNGIIPSFLALMTMLVFAVYSYFIPKSYRRYRSVQAQFAALPRCSCRK
jgi:Ca2+/Na+ antiporter